MKLFIFGSTGDLVKRKVLPALQAIQTTGLEIWAIGRQKLSREDYVNLVCGKDCSNDFKKRFNYIQTNFNADNTCLNCSEILDRKETNYFYISMPPKLSDRILSSLSKFKKSGFKIKILMEKPFGESLESAKKLEKLIKDNNIEKDIFLSDHYLFKKNVINLKKVDFAKVEITAIEKLGLENRASYYDDVGALKDMVQSHFFNIVFKLINDSKELISARVVNYIRAQYIEGDGAGYSKELGGKSESETFVYLKLKSKTKEFKFITGKAFSEKQSELKVDRNKFSLDDGKPYESIFLNFFLNKKSLFPTISNAILSWEIIEKINTDKPKLQYYKKGSLLKEISFL